ncbi:MAG: glycoside hydrolase family 20 zincin-like fold domain-containing protein [Chitinophagaceae bacterium]
MKHLLFLFIFFIFHFSFSQAKEFRMYDPSKDAVILIERRAWPTPSIIPLPQQVKWKNGFFYLTLCKAIIVKDISTKKEADYLQKELKEKGVTFLVTQTTKANQPFIEISIDNRDSLASDEAYSLKVNAQKILLTAKTAHGIFNGIQTLLQLIQNGNKVRFCEIADWPAFSWRGYILT